MKTLIAIAMGFFSGLLVYIMAAMLSIDLSAGAPSHIGVLILTFFIAWVLSAIVLRRGARTVSKVFARGFLLGAAEWLCMVLVGIIFSGRAVNDVVSRTHPESTGEIAGATMGGGIMAILAGGVSLFMVVLCLAGFAVAHFMGREMKPELATPGRKCPECAELIQLEARRCRFCGAQMDGGAPLVDGGA